MTRTTIIVGTGRCGSTLISDLMGLRDDVLSLSEFFVCLSPLGFPAEALTGAGFWRILAEPRSKPNTLLRHGAAPPEFRYPATGRFPAGSVPAVSLVTLPALTDDPDALYDELAQEVTTWSRAAVTVQYQRLFGWLCRRFEREAVIERSGGSLRFLPDLTRSFPDAGFVHMYRNGPDCALSMSRHTSFRLAAAISLMKPYIGVDPYHEPSSDHRDKLPDLLRRLLPGDFDAGVLRDLDLPVKMFGALWSQQLASGAGTLASLPTDRVLHMSYEALLASPAPELDRLASFSGLPANPGWLATAASRVDDGRSGGAQRLKEESRESLVRACALGTRILERLTVAEAA